MHKENIYIHFNQTKQKKSPAYRVLPKRKIGEEQQNLFLYPLAHPNHFLLSLSLKTYCTLQTKDNNTAASGLSVSSVECLGFGQTTN